MLFQQVLDRNSQKHAKIYVGLNNKPAIGYLRSLGLDSSAKGNYNCKYDFGDGFYALPILLAIDALVRSTGPSS